MYNPMTTERVKKIVNQLPPVQVAFLDAVNDFAYQTTAPLESNLGEYAGHKYDRDALVQAVRLSVRKMTVDEGKRIHTERLLLIRVMAQAGFAPDMLQHVEDIVDKEVTKIIDECTGIANGQQVFHVKNAHHGRQHIAAQVVEKIALNLV